MAKLLSIRNIYYLLLGLCVVSFVATLIGWAGSGNFQAESADESLKRETATRIDHHLSHIGIIVTPRNQVHQTTRSSHFDHNSTTLNAKALWWAKQAKRLFNLRKTCRLYQNFGEKHTISELTRTRRSSFWYFIVDDNHRLIYTWIAKAGSTNWMSAFLVLKGKYKSIEDVPLQQIGKERLVKLSSFREEGIKQRLANYTNFIFVRHPFVRLLSAYRNKLEEPNNYYPKRVGVWVIRRFRKNANAEALKKGTDVTFPEFVRYLVNTKHLKLDHHWRPMYKMVLPCTVRFDYIGKLETWEEDAKNILQETHVDHLVHFKPTQRKVSHNETTFNWYYSQIPKGDLVRLYKMYKPDFLLFGYQIPDSMNATLSGV